MNDEALWEFVESGDADKIRECLDAGANPSAPNAAGFPALSIAVSENNTEAVAALLAHPETNSNIVDAHETTPLAIAAHDGNIEIAALLIERGVDVNLLSRDFSALMYATQESRFDVAELLLQNGADTEIASDGTTALFNASAEGNHEAVDLLLRYGANVNFCQPLTLACAYRQMRMAERLLDAGANINAADEDGDTSLHFAIKSGNAATVALLLGRGASRTAVNKQGRAALHTARRIRSAKTREAILAVLR